MSAWAAECEARTLTRAVDKYCVAGASGADVNAEKTWDSLGNADEAECTVNAGPEPGFAKPKIQKEG